MEQGEDENIATAIRVKPLSRGERPALLRVTDRALILHDQVREREYTTGRVFAPETTQAEVFEHVRPQLAKFLDGYNCTVIAYGMTGSGKTHTMFGSASLEDRGLIPRIVEHVLEGAF